jgi:Tol biopolymer transport system component
MAQDDTVDTNSKLLHFGQRPPGMSPEIFAPGIISTEEYEFGGTFSPDGKEYYFTRRPTHQGSENRIYYSRLIDAGWTDPQIAQFAEDIFEFEPVITPDGQRLYFYSERQGERNERYDGDLWYVERKGGGWTEAMYFPSTINKKYVMMISATMNGTLYFSGIFNGKRGVYLSKHDSNKYLEIEYLPEEINSIPAAHPYIAPDESYIIFDSQVTGMGKPELYISFRKAENTWTKAVNMGPIINATKTEFGASVSPDGKYMFFNRRVDGNGDVYWVSAEIIEILKADTINRW